MAAIHAEGPLGEPTLNMEGRFPLISRVNRLSVSNGGSAMQPSRGRLRELRPSTATATISAPSTRPARSSRSIGGTSALTCPSARARAATPTAYSRPCPPGRRTARHRRLVAVLDPLVAVSTCWMGSMVRANGIPETWIWISVVGRRLSRARYDVSVRVAGFGDDESRSVTVRGEPDRPTPRRRPLRSAAAATPPVG
jgi:hypothetical protein